MAGCLGDDEEDDDITIGAIQPLSGPFSPWAEVHQAGLEFAVEEINEDGGVLGRDLVVESNDTGSDPTDADSFFREFVEQENAVAITGPVSSDVGIRTSDTAQELQTPMFLHMSGDDGVISDDRQFTFRIGLLPASNTMISQNQLIEARGYENVGAVVADYAWGRAIEAAIEEHVTADVQIEVAPVGADDFRGNLRNLDEDIELLLATGHPPGNFSIAAQAIDIGLQPDAVTGSGFPPGVIRSALGELSEEVFLHYHMSDYTSPEYVEVAEAFSEATGEPFHTHHSYGYVTGQVIATAIEEAGEASGPAIQETLQDIEVDTLYAEALSYANYGEPDGQVQIYSEFTSDPADYAPDEDWGLNEVFRSDPLPAAGN
ncbi:MAG: ABC transporter substrate-binding protein [Halobacteriota archaeon]